MEKTKTKSTINRDISWMYFNKRILNEAANQSVPLLERLKFLGIYSSNLDEFFRVRIATLRRMVDIEKKLKNTGLDTRKILRKLLKLNEEYTHIFEKIFAELKTELEKEKIFFLNETQLTDHQKEYVLGFYRDELMNSLFPLLISKMSNEPVLNDHSIFLAVKISKNTDTQKGIKKEYALIEIPTKTIPRFITLPSDDDNTYIIFSDDVIRFCLPLIFSQLGYDKTEAYTVKFTRDAEMDFDNSVYYSALEKVSKGVSSRKKGNAVRIVYDREIPSDLFRYISKILKLDKSDAHVSSGRYHNLKDLMSFPDNGRCDLKYAPEPTIPVPDFDRTENLLKTIREKDRYLHFPYHSFDYFIRLLRESAINPEVREIKITVYRLAKNSKIVQALICAAMNGKKVTVSVELLARFDEESNINWAKKMQDAGIKILFGVDGLKVHSKICHITARHGNIACVATGNFHEGTAQIYTDFMLLTANKEIVNEVDKVFEFLKQPYLNPIFKQLMVSPMYMRKRLLHLIKNETENAAKGKPAYIYCKINHVVDDKIIEKLHLASKTGVDIKMLVRGNCALIPGIPGLSQHIEVTGIIDRFLEHARIMIFANGGNELYFIGSADWMQRNLDNRVEVYVPILDPELKNQLKTIIEYGLKDNTKARVVDGTDQNTIRKTDAGNDFRSQTELYSYYRNALNTTQPE